MISEYQRQQLLATIQSSYVSLHTSDPGTTGAGEVSGNRYARQHINMTNGINTEVVDFIDMPGVEVSFTGLWDAPTGGHFLWGGPLTTTKSLDIGDIFRINKGDLQAEFS